MTGAGESNPDSNKPASHKGSGDSLSPRDDLVEPTPSTEPPSIVMPTIDVTAKVRPGRGRRRNPVVWLGLIAAIAALALAIGGVIHFRSLSESPETDWSIDDHMPDVVHLTLPAACHDPLCFTFSPDGMLLASGHSLGEVVLWDAATGAPRRSLGTHGKPVWWVRFFDEGRVLASFSKGQETRGEGGLLNVWDVPTGGLLGALPIERTVVGQTPQIAIGPQGKTVAALFHTWKELPSGNMTYDDKSDLIVWDTASRELLWKFDGGPMTTAIAITHDGQSLVSAIRREPVVRHYVEDVETERRGRTEIFVRDLQTGEIERTWMIDGFDGKMLEPLRDGKTLGVVHSWGFLVLDMESGDVTSSFEWQHHMQGLTGGLRLAADGSQIATYWYDFDERVDTHAHFIEILTAGTGERLLLRSSINSDVGKGKERLPGDNRWYWDSVAFSPDLKRMACRWNGPFPVDGYMIAELEKLPMDLHPLARSP